MTNLVLSGITLNPTVDRDENLQGPTSYIVSYTVKILEQSEFGKAIK
jgi:hypothetical protein